MPTILMTSLEEIRVFEPCASGWKKILAAKGGVSKADFSQEFSIASCLESNSISDVLWLIGARESEIQIAVRFAEWCGRRAKKFTRPHIAAAYAAYAAAYAADAAFYASAAYAASAAFYASASASASAAFYASASASAAAEINLQKQVLADMLNHPGRFPIYSDELDILARSEKEGA